MGHILQLINCDSPNVCVCEREKDRPISTQAEGKHTLLRLNKGEQE